MRYALSFASFLTLISSAAVAQDADGDGVIDPVDQVPCDPRASALAFAPAENSFGMLMFEDRWPQRGDLDFNDVVLAHHYTFELDTQGRVARARLHLQVLAAGGTLHNGLGLHLPVPRLNSTTITRRVNNVSMPLVPSFNDAEQTVVLSTDLRELFANESNPINSRRDLARRSGNAMDVEIVFNPPIAMNTSAAPFDLFIYRTDVRGHEIHRPEYSGTAVMAQSLFGSSDDGSVANRWFVDDTGLPFALSLPQLAQYPAEEEEIAQLYPAILTFASSGGAGSRDFYRSNVVSSFAYRDSAGQAQLAPTVPAYTVDMSCNPVICSGPLSTYYRDADGDGYGNSAESIQACSARPGYVSAASCSNGSLTDCNVAGTTLIASSAFVDVNTPAGWQQCAGFINTTGNDVLPNFLNNCLNTTSLRIRVWRADGVLEEDIAVSNQTSWASWPNWNYLGGSVTAHLRTRWGQTNFFTTTDGRDACGQAAASNGNTFGTGNGSVAIVAGGNSGADEYRISCGGESLAGRRIAIYRGAPAQQSSGLDCNDQSTAIRPGAAESCNTIDDDCDGVSDEGNPGGGASCNSGLLGVCSAGTVTCTNGGLICVANRAAQPETCANGLDDDCDGLTDEAACSRACSNGSGTDCNVAGSTLIASNAFVDTAPPSGWTQCAGFLNTTANDVNANFLDNCLGTNRLRIRVWNMNTGALEEDIQTINMSTISSWPNWNYLGGSMSTFARTYWGQTTFFTTTNGVDACGSQAAPNGNTFGTGNGSVAIVVGGNSGADEYRVSCGGQSLSNRRIAIYR